MFRHLTPRLVSRLVLLALVGFGTTLLIVPARSDAEQQVAAPKAAAAIFPAELVSFRPADKAPVFAAAGPGHWDVKIRERGWILHEADGWHLWYTGYDGTREGRKLLGYATSADGVEWKRHPDNPLVRDHWVEDMMVVKQGDTYYMFAEGEEDQAQLLTSPDRLHWTRVGTLDIRYTNGDRLTPGPFGTPTAWYEEGTWYLFFERRDAGIWLATSKDLKVFTHLQDEPVILPGPGKYDQQMIALNQIIKHGGRYYASLHGSGDEQPPRSWSTNIAESTDLRHWTKYTGNPIIPGNRSSGVFVPDGKQFRLYTMHDRVELFLPTKP